MRILLLALVLTFSFCGAAELIGFERPTEQRRLVFEDVILQTVDFGSATGLALRGHAAFYLFPKKPGAQALLEQWRQQHTPLVFEIDAFTGRISHLNTRN